MEYGIIEREIQIDASAEVVFEVVSSPEHLREWWPDDITLDPVPGGTGELIFGSDEDPRAKVVAVTVMEAEPYRLFSFRWTHPAHDVATAANSLLVTFELTPNGAGTTLKMTEVGFREQGWDVAVLEQQYNDHVNGWDFFIPRLGEYVNRLVASR